ncbi:MAG: excinuclease ABC subunit UvrA [Lentisphaeria bacterium]|nr:excinuclease ABC subunit UvrA [Lentisphaeria bacterium]
MPIPKSKAALPDITIKGARHHNLKNINVCIPRNQLVVVTGPSGSGKSSLAFDTLYAEGQRRYVESLSAYARQFLDQLQKPEVDHIDGLAPAIAIEQRSAGASPRSIVATTTEIYDYLRLLFAHIGTPHCPNGHGPIHSQSPQQIAEQIATIEPGKKLMLLAPVITGQKGEHKDVLENIRKDGFVRARVDGKITSLDSVPTLKKNFKHSIDVVVDRLVSGKLDETRLQDSVERSLRYGEGVIYVLVEDKGTEEGWHEEVMSEHLACHKCGFSSPELQPRNFSFNSPYGACPECHGLGNQDVIIEEKLLDPTKALEKNAIPLIRTGPRRLINYYFKLLHCVADHYDVDMSLPFGKLPQKVQEVMLYGSGNEHIQFRFRWGGRIYSQEKPYEGIIPLLIRRYQETESPMFRDRMRKVLDKSKCQACNGSRLKPASRSVYVHGISIVDFIQLNVYKALEYVEGLKLNKTEATIATEILREVRERLFFLESVGLGYLTLDRESGTLSGGEAQRIRLATQLGSGLTGVLYVLDEPSIGLHQRDNDRLLATLARLRDAGNTVVVVEHDLDTILAADHVLDLGPGAGAHGGELIFAGPPSKLNKSKDSLTAQYTSGKKEIALPEKRLKGNGSKVQIQKANKNNLKNVSVTIPLGTFTCVTGVSGSGKSSLINGILVPEMIKALDPKKKYNGKHLKGTDAVTKMIVIDQSPIGRTPRSNPATYTGAFDIIRQLFAKLPDAQIRGYKPGRFSFNVKGGRCESCSGDGIRKIEMQFLPDVFVTCEQCNGKRYNEETLKVKFKGKSIADVLAMTVEESVSFFKHIPKLHRILKTIEDVGLAYITLGQSATTLSGGEAQRMKLATQLAKPPRGQTLYILDEPTTGLHIDDVNKLMEVLQILRDKGNTVLVIEHNLDVIKIADHIIDMGPEGGESGGKVIAQGTPEKVAKSKTSHTGFYLKKMGL